MSKKHPSPSLPLRELFQLRPTTVVRRGLDKLSGYKAAKKRPHIDKRKTRNSPPLTGRQKYVNHVISKRRCRVEHVFGQIKQFGGDTVRTIGMARCAVRVALVNIVYNMLRFACLKFQEQQALTA